MRPLKPLVEKKYRSMPISICRQCSWPAAGAGRLGVVALGLPHVCAHSRRRGPELELTSFVCILIRI